MTAPSSDVHSPASSGPIPEVDSPDFEDEVARRLWENYVERIESMLAPLHPAARREIVQELKVHLLDSIRHDEAQAEAERVLNATERLGRPEDFLEPIVTDRIIEEGAATYNPLWIVKGLGRTLTRGVKNTILGLFFGIGYLLAAVTASLAVLKPFFPSHVGLFRGTGEGAYRWAFGYIDQTEGMTELLGNWIIPISLALAVLLYLGLTKMLVLLRSSE